MQRWSIMHQGHVPNAVFEAEIEVLPYPMMNNVLTTLNHERSAAVILEMVSPYTILRLLQLITYLYQKSENQTLKFMVRAGLGRK
jgi:hypothetical protein